MAVLASSPPVVVFPAHAPERSALGRAATDAIMAAPVAGAVQVVRPWDVRGRLGFDLSEQALTCQRDHGCLARLASLVGAERFVVVTLTPSEAQRVALSVELCRVPGVVERTVRWRMEATEAIVRPASVLAVRELLTPSDARLRIDLSPPDALVSVYGQPLAAGGTPVPFWSGVYDVVVSRPGFVSSKARLTVTPGDNPPLRYELDPAAQEVTALGAPSPAPTGSGGTLVWAAAAGSVAALAGARVMYGVAAGRLADANEAYAAYEAAPYADLDRLEIETTNADDDARLFVAISYGLGAVGVVLAGTALYAWLSGGPGEGPIEAGTGPAALAVRW